MSKKLGKHIFILQDIDSEFIFKKYGIVLNINLNSKQIQNPENITKITDLPSDNTQPLIISFLSESKSIVKCNVVMIDISNKNIDSIKGIDCYWCRYPFDTQPIGCPIKYISNQLVKTYYSEISKDKYTIKENITNKKTKNINLKKSPENGEDKRLNVVNNDYYETDGIFCSFNCCKAFINDNKHKAIYDDSNRLLIQMYNQIFGTKINHIKEADNWRLLEKAGGFIKINKFKENFNHVNYEYHGYISDICKPIGHLWEEHIKF